MLAAHRDQENLVVSQQVPTKQQHNSRFPKTPSRFPQHDENAPTAFTGKAGLGGLKTLNKGNGTRQAMVTPMGTQNRAPLGNKTTNAKAKNGQLGGVKNIVKDIEQTQFKPTAQKPKQIPVDLAPLEIRLKEEQKPIEPQEEEPEYAPPRPKDLPYESDCFPKDMLTLEGLKKDNLLKGYYQHFFNPVDDNGVSRQDREFAETMKKVATKAEERNKQETDALTFNIDDLSDDELQIKAPAPKPTITDDSERKVKGVRTKQPSSLASRRAASALSIHSDASSNSKASSAARTTKMRKPLTSLYQSKKPVAKSAVPAKTSHADRATGVAASRTTIGYSRGRSASSMVNAQRRGTIAPVGTQRAIKPTETISSLQSGLTITPARLRQAVKQQEEVKSRPQFMSIFEDGEDDDLPPLSQPLHISDDEEEEFELKLTF
ncbi:hypothetical protein FBEOM_9962 [Fusarium beomiforme]|uniref:Uncharacterized protein n=1 Tax=Fusarium beomiforme TaxID=44412 RepID=A0A9P5DUQ4_9HYPO|nr:hypothetical protein FBEOM_9962 [Fusarium beomiforme]